MEINSKKDITVTLTLSESEFLNILATIGLVSNHDAKLELVRLNVKNAEECYIDGFAIYKKLRDEAILNNLIN